MAVKIRLRRMGKKRQPSYRVVVADGRSPRDGRFIEQIGRYDPLQEPSLVEIDNDRALDWLSKGAQPTAAARKLLEISGAWGRFKASKGEVHTIGEVAPPPPKEKKSRKKKAAEAAAAAADSDAAAAAPEAADAAEGAAATEEADAPEAAAAETTTEDTAPAEEAATEEAPAAEAADAADAADAIEEKEES